MIDFEDQLIRFPLWIKDNDNGEMIDYNAYEKAKKEYRIKIKSKNCQEKMFWRRNESIWNLIV
jgi:tRNA A37 threonylcarbamoyltransferase TsaD